MNNVLTFKLATTEEICAALGDRLKAERLAQGMLQADLAVRAGVSRGTVKTFENTGQCTVHSLVRMVRSLGLEGELQDIFVPRSRSIAEMERSAAGRRQRASRKQRSVATK